MLLRQVQGTAVWYITTAFVPVVLTIPDATIVSCGASSPSTTIHPQANYASTGDTLLQVEGFG